MQGAKLEQLLKSSDHITQILNYLKGKLANDQNHLDEDAIEYFQHAYDLKMQFRFLTDGLETNRALVQVQKEKIQKSKVFLEGLQYYKATLKQKIGNSRLDLVSVKDYIDEQPSASTNWIQDFKAQQQKILSTLQSLKQKKVLQQQKQLQKQELSMQMQSCNQKFKKTFPQQVKKLYSQVAQTSKLFNIKQVDTMQLTNFKSQQLQRIYAMFYPLKLKGLIQMKHLNQQVEELQITVQKGFFNLYDYARANKILIEERPFKFYIASIFKQTQFQQYQFLALSVSRRQDFTTEEIFSHLLLREKIKLIYQNPTSEAERNLNNKYSHLQWISKVLASPSSLISGSQLIEKIKQKMFSLYLTRYAVQNITKKVPAYFFPLFRSDEVCFTQKSFQLIQGKKLFFTKFQKTTFEQYKKNIFIPEWIYKALNNYHILKEEQKVKGDSIDVENYEKIDRFNLDHFISMHHLEELQSNDHYLYFKFDLLLEKNVLTGYLLIPTNYPTKKSVIKLVTYKKITQTSAKLTTTKQIQILIENNLQNENKNIHFTEELNELEVELNQKIYYFINKQSDTKSSKSTAGLLSKSTSSSEQVKNKEYFFVYFQINRLISLLIEKSQQNEN